MADSGVTDEELVFTWADRWENDEVYGSLATLVDLIKKVREEARAETFALCAKEVECFTYWLADGSTCYGGDQLRAIGKKREEAPVRPDPCGAISTTKPDVCLLPIGHVCPHGWEG